MAQSTRGSLPTPTYFSDLAASYARSTGNATFTLFDQVLRNHVQTSPTPIDSKSVVHDNAAGPGTATGAILQALGRDGFPSSVLVSDDNAAMMKGARDTFAGADVPSDKITFEELDAAKLESVKDGQFTHSITNFSVFAFGDAPTSLRGIHRTLQPGGLAVITTWRRFGAGEVVAAAQARVRPDLPSMPVCGPEWFTEGFLEGELVDAGFEKEKMKTVREDLAVGPSEALEGLRGFMKGPLTKRAREGWTDEEEARWSDVVDEAIQEEVEKFGGILFESWAVLVKK